MISHHVRILSTPVTWVLVGTAPPGLREAPSAPPHSTALCASPKLAPHVGDPWSGGFRKQRELLAWAVFLPRHLTPGLQGGVPGGRNAASADEHPPACSAPSAHTTSPRKTGLPSNLYRSGKVQFWFPKAQERGPGCPLTAAPFYWPPADSMLVRHLPASGPLSLSGLLSVVGILRPPSVAHPGARQRSHRWKLSFCDCEIRSPGAAWVSAPRQSDTGRGGTLPAKVVHHHCHDAPFGTWAQDGAQGQSSLSCGRRGGAHLGGEQAGERAGGPRVLVMGSVRRRWRPQAV